MVFKKAKIEELDQIMRIIRKAQEQFRKDGIDQWQDNYPNEEIIGADIERGESYILLKDGEVIGTVYLSFEEESDYDKIYEGAWISQEPYAVIHRLAVDLERKGQGLASVIMEEAVKMSQERGFKSIKVDTHRENKAMQRLLLKNGFQNCGLIYLKDGAERLAFEKIIDQEA